MIRARTRARAGTLLLSSIALIALLACKKEPKATVTCGSHPTLNSHVRCKIQDETASGDNLKVCFDVSFKCPDGAVCKKQGACADVAGGTVLDHDISRLEFDNEDNNTCSGASGYTVENVKTTKR